MIAFAVFASLRAIFLSRKVEKVRHHNMFDAVLAPYVFVALLRLRPCSGISNHSQLIP